MGATTRRSLHFDEPSSKAVNLISTTQLCIVPSPSATQAAMLLPGTTARVVLHDLPSTTVMGIPQQPPSTRQSTSWLSLPGRLLTSVLRSEDAPHSPNDTPTQPTWTQSPSPLPQHRTPPSSSKNPLRASGTVAPAPAAVSVALKRRNSAEELHEVHDVIKVLELKYWCMAKCRAPSNRIALRVHELPPTGSGDYSLTKLARSFTRSGQDTPSSRRSMGRAQQLAGWASYLLLPEVLGRELRGDGVLAWLQQRVALVLQSHQGDVSGSSCVVHVDLYSSAPMALACGAEVAVGQVLAKVQAETGVAVSSLRLVAYEKRPRWWLVEAATGALLRVVLLHLQLAQAWVDMALAVVHLWRPAGIAGVCVAVDGGDHSYTFNMPLSASVAQVAHAVRQREAQWCVQRIT